MDGNLTTLTERGQVPMPAALRTELRLRPGQALKWQMISDTECRVLILREPKERSNKPMRGFMKQFQSAMPETTEAWMKLLREGENA